MTTRLQPVPSSTVRRHGALLSYGQGNFTVACHSSQYDQGVRGFNWATLFLGIGMQGPGPPGWGGLK
jgi:hypothetical protein